MKNIVLTGMMGCGKSTAGALLSQALGRELVDTDAWIQAREGRSISEIFAAEGEGYFRDRETEAAKALAGRHDLVIACGGGLPLREESIAPLKETGVVFWLRRDPGETYDGLDTGGRPLARQGRQAFLARFAAREPVYRRWADYIIRDFSTPQATAQAILNAWNLG